MFIHMHICLPGVHACSKGHNEVDGRQYQLCDRELANGAIDGGKTLTQLVQETDTHHVAVSVCVHVFACVCVRV